MSIESKSIDYIPDHERHGRAIDQGPFWFLGNFHFLTIAIGFVGPSMGLSFGYTAMAGALGTLFGTVFVALHASQGPEIGLPQMIQSRAQFGFRGVVVVLFGTLVTFIGFNIVNSVLSANGLNGILGWNTTGITLSAALIAVGLAVAGYDWLHRVFRWCFWLSLPLYVPLTMAILSGRIAPVHLNIGGFTWVAFLAQFATSASFNLTSAPCVSDFSRYLRRETGRTSIIAAVFLGSSASSIWFIALGGWLATRFGASDGLVALRDAGNAFVPGFGVPMALASVVILVATMGMNTYSAMLTVITILNSLFETSPTPRLRVATIAVLVLVWVPVSLIVGGNSNSIMVLFSGLTLMLYLLVPWTSINLIDYFLIRRGHYAVTDLFSPTGIYGAWNFAGLTSYVIALMATLPFVLVPGIYTGPVARALGGIDVGWLVGLLVSGAVYVGMSRSIDLTREAGAISNSINQLARPADVRRSRAS